jgi:putative oxidoreductase
MSDTAEARGLVFRGLARTYEALAPWGYTLMRFSAGAVVVYHGYAKLFAGFAPVVAKNVLTPLGFPLPVVWAYFLGVLELVGGAALAIGLLTRPLALLFVIELAIVTYWHSGNGYFFTSPGGGWEFPLLLMLQYLGILLAGAGRHSVDRMLGREF